MANTIFSIIHDEQDPHVLHVQLVAATEMSFDISTADRDFSEIIRDVCYIAPSLMRYDSDLMEAYDDAFRTEPRKLDAMRIGKFMQKYSSALSNVDIDFLEEG